jgi:hypothetical protein
MSASRSVPQCPYARQSYNGEKCWARPYADLCVRLFGIDVRELLSPDGTRFASGTLAARHGLRASPDRRARRKPREGPRTVLRPRPAICAAVWQPFADSHVCIDGPAINAAMVDAGSGLRDRRFAGEMVPFSRSRRHAAWAATDQLVQPPRYTALAGLAAIADDRVHSKSFSAATAHGSSTPMKHRGRPKDFEFFTRSRQNRDRAMLV